jgi:hypothetical protein
MLERTVKKNQNEVSNLHLGPVLFILYLLILILGLDLNMGWWWTARHVWGARALAAVGFFKTYVKQKQQSSAIPA